MKQKSAFVGVLALLFMFTLILPSTMGAEAKPGTTPAFDSYHSPAQVNQLLKKLASANPGITKLHKIAVTPGGRPLYIMEIGPETGRNKKTLPAVFTAAGMEGVPIAHEAALYLVKLLLEKPEARKDKTWYILPVGNPDAAARYFQKPLHADGRNDRPHNDDMDDRVDEDGVEDLDGNGIITMMRVKDPEGSWMPVPGEPRLMKKADWSKDEKGIYKLYTEGIDNDGDGRYNEDGPGGVNAGINFPHLFKAFTKDGGEWPGCIDETFSLFQFIFQHPEIAMTISFGETNFCMMPPRGGRKGTADLSKIKIPKRIAKRMNMDPEKTYTMKEIMDLIRPRLPAGMEIDESMVASFLGLGAAVNPQGPDLKFYKKVSEKYKDFLKANKLDAKRLEPPRAKDGSFELWAYYQLGVPSFAMDFWSLPKPQDKSKKKPDITPEKLETMSKEDFLALGKEKIAAFLKSVGAPPNIKADMVIEMVSSDRMTPKRMAEMMKRLPKPKSKEGADPKEKALLAFSDKELKGKGFVDWKSFQHPTLGEVEIGGAVPYSANTPPAPMLENLLKGQVPWALVLADKAARVKLARTRVKSLGSGLYRIEAWIENAGYLPYPTAMGKRNKRISPVAAVLKGKNFQILEGKKRNLIKEIPGRGAKKVQWVVRAEKPITLNLEVSSFNAWSDTAAVQLGGAR
jgi:hypothetical protein